MIPKTGFSQNPGDIRITGDFQDMPVTRFLSTIEDQYGIKFFYKENWIEPFNINESFEETPLSEALDNIFAGREITLGTFQKKTILIYPGKSNTRLNLENYNQLLVIGDPINKGKYKTAKIVGKVLDGKTQEPLTGAVVYNYKLQKGATSDKNGNFTLDLPTGEHTLTISFMGFEEMQKRINLIEPGNIELEIFEEVHNIDEVTVTADEFNFSRTQTSIEQLDSKTIKNLPLLMGERDILKSIVMLPGIQTTGELASGFNVRGGNSDQNLILLSGSPIFNPSHLFGFLSTINPDLVEDLRVFKGGLPASYGERVSSIMEIDLKDGNNEMLKFSGGLGIINSRLAIEGPLTKNKKLTFVAGGRTSYTDWILKQVPDPDISNSVTSFYDISSKFSYKFNQNNWLNITAYSSNDEFSTSSQSVNNYGNTLFGINSHNKYGINLNGELNLSYSKYSFRLTDFANGKDFEAYFLNNQIQYHSLKYNMIWHPFPEHNLHSGINAIYYLNDPGKIAPYSGITTITEMELDREKAFESAIYLSDEFDLVKGLTVNLGIRYSHFALFGEKTVFIYDEDQVKSPESVTDSLHFNNGEVVKSYGGIEPRISFNYKIDNNFLLKMSYQRVRQYINQISNNAVVSPAETWKTSDYLLEPLISDQFVLGISNDKILKNFSLTTEIYFKSLQNLIEYKNGAQIIMNRHLETDLIPSDGYSCGVEFSFNKKEGRLTGWINYVFSRTMRKTTGNYTSELINKGKYYPSIYDRPHDFSVVATYNLSRRWRVSGNFIYISGRPVTLPEVEYQFAGETLIYYSDRNKYRMPPYHRFDISITLDENLKRKRSWKGSWTLSVYNLYGRKNPYSVYYRKTQPGSETANREYSLFKLSVIGIPVPSLTYNFTF
ncbi:MAG: TonB-dependent receptor [Prolixibacteraceae bacterium]|nr:TonB-dependent receptor [Prolixibacteraceae bacterium]